MRNNCDQTMYPVLGFAGWSGSGKTTLIERLLPALKERGLLTAVIKHDAHGLKLYPDADPRQETLEDVAGTDSWRFRRAGADAVILSGPGGPDLQEAVQRAARALSLARRMTDKRKDAGCPAEVGFSTGQCCRPGIILVEGFKHASIPRIGLCREASGKGFTEDISAFEAIVTDWVPERNRPDADRPEREKPDEDRPEREKPDENRPDGENPDRNGLPGQKKGGVPAFEPENIKGITEFIIQRFFMGTEGEAMEHKKAQPRPSMDAWRREAAKEPDAAKIGMYLVHNGIVRASARAAVREGREDTGPVKKMLFSYDRDKAAAAEQMARQMEGIYYTRIWLNEGELEVGEDIMCVMIGGDTRPHTVAALEKLVEELKTNCVREEELF